VRGISRSTFPGPRNGPSGSHPPASKLERANRYDVTVYAAENSHRATGNESGRAQRTLAPVISKAIPKKARITVNPLQLLKFRAILALSHP
jgi:hypothetical protein